MPGWWTRNLLSLWILSTGCPSGPDRELGATCADSAQCIHGLCYEGRCARASDDLDGDCIPNADDRTVDDRAALRRQLCRTEGVCANATLKCPDIGTTPYCSYNAVVGYEPDGETRCDFLDNDCDGDVDNVVAGVVCCQKDLECDDANSCTDATCGFANTCVVKAIDSLLCDSPCVDSLSLVTEVGPSAFGDVRDVAMDGDTAYLATDYGVVALDVATPTAPTRLWQRALGGSAYLVAPDATQLSKGVLVASSGGLNRYTVGSEGVVTSSTFDPGGAVTDLLSYSDGSLVVATTSSVQFWGLSGVAPDKMPAELAVGQASLASSDAGLLVATADELRVVDIGGLPTSVATTHTSPVTTFTSLNGMAVAGDTLILVGTGTTGGGLLELLDIAVPSAPNSLGNLADELTFTSASLAPAGDRVYLATAAGVRSLALDPARSGEAAVTDDVPLAGAATVAATDDVVAVAAGPDGLIVRAATELANPALGSVTDPPSRALDLAVAGTTLYVALGERGLGQADATDPSTLVAVEPIDEGRAVQRVRALQANDLLLLAGFGPSGSVDLLDIDDPALGPNLLATLDPPPNATTHGVAMTDSDQLLVAYGATGIDVIDVSVPSTPVRLETVAPPEMGSALGIDARGQRVYLAAGPVGVVVYYATPDGLAPLGTANVGGTVTAVAVDSSGARVAAVVAADVEANVASGLVIVDVDAGDSPTPLGPVVSLPTSGHDLGSSVAWRAPYLAVAGRESGVYLFGEQGAGLELVSRFDTPGDARGVVWGARDHLLVADDLTTLTVLQPDCGR